MEIRKDVVGGQPVTLTAKSGPLSLLLNNQNSLSVSPQLTRQGSFVVVISKDKIEGAGGKRYQILDIIDTRDCLKIWILSSEKTCFDTVR